MKPNEHSLLYMDDETDNMFCVGLSLWKTRVLLGPALVVLIMIAKCQSAITIRKLWTNKGLLLGGPGNYKAHLRPHLEVTSRESMQRPGVRFLLGSRVGAYGFVGWLLVNLRYKSREFKRQEGAKRVAQMISYCNQSWSLKQRSLTVGRWPASL